MDEKATLLRYLRVQHEAMLWKLDGLSPREARMPLTTSGTNLLGIVKHSASVQAGYLGDCFGRPWPEPMPWFAEDAEPNADMFATEHESVEGIVAFARRVQAHSEATIEALPLDAPGRVPWWGEEPVTLHRILVHVITELARHAGHMDIVREQLDGARGLREGSDNMPEVDDTWWGAYTARLRAIAEAAVD